MIDTQFDSVGIEWHPDTTELYACTNFGGNCNNLAAPWTEVQCVEDIPFN